MFNECFQLVQIKEKEMMYKRYREESEAARMVCDILIPFWHIFQFTIVVLMIIWWLWYVINIQKHCRWRKKKHWNSWEGRWFHMLGLSPNSTIPFAHKSKNSDFGHMLFVFFSQFFNWWMIFAPHNRSTREITKAKSPQLRVLQRRERRKFLGAISSATAYRWWGWWKIWLACSRTLEPELKLQRYSEL